MKKRRIQYNEIYEEIYDPKNWNKTRLISVGVLLFIIGFLFNFSLEEKINRWMLENLSKNEACPIVFERSELKYFLPSLTIYKPSIMGNCFGQPANQLRFNSIKVSLVFPSFYPIGIKFHVHMNDGKTRINVFPVLSFFSNTISINETIIDGSLFAPLSSDNKSIFSGKFSIDGFFKISSGIVEDGQLTIFSNSISIPPQNIRGFEVTQLSLGSFKFDAHFSGNNLMKIDRLEIGKKNSPLEMKLKGSLNINSSSFMQSMLDIKGSLYLSDFILNNFSFLKLFLPAQNTTGTYQMRLAGPLYSLGPVQFN